VWGRALHHVTSAKSPGTAPRPPDRPGAGRSPDFLVSAILPKEGHVIVLPKKLLSVILLLSAISVLAENAAKYPLRVQLVKDHLVYEMIPTELGKGTGLGIAVPQDAEVRTLGIVVIDGKAYNLTCESDASLDPGQYSGRWEKQDKRLSLLAPEFCSSISCDKSQDASRNPAKPSKPARLSRVNCKTSPYNGNEHFEHSQALPPGRKSPTLLPQPPPAPPAPTPMVR